MSNKLMYAVNDVQRAKPGTNGEIEKIGAGRVFEGTTAFFKSLEAHNAVREPTEAEIALYEREKTAGEAADQESVIPVGGAVSTGTTKPLTAAQKKAQEKAAEEAAERQKKADEEAAAKQKKLDDEEAARKAAEDQNVL